MNTITDKIIYLCLLLISVDSIAGVADLEITLNHQPLDNLQFGDTGQFSITLTNHGPDEAGANSPVERSISAFAISEVEGNVGVPLDFVQDSSEPQECDFLLSAFEPRPPNPLAFAYEFYYPTIQVGESITCYGLFLVLFNSGSRDIEWNVFPGLDTDPNPTNNSQSMIFGIQPRAVTTLTSHTLFALSILIFSVGFISLRKKHLIDRLTE